MFVIVFVSSLYAFYTVVRARMSIKDREKELLKYSENIEKVISETDKLTFATWSDQQRGILFVENPAFKSKYKGELTKHQEIERSLNSLMHSIESDKKELVVLQHKEKIFIKEIEKLSQEL